MSHVFSPRASIKSHRGTLMDCLFLNGHTRAGANNNVEKELSVELSAHDKKDRKDLARMNFMAVQ
jgi:hypothetical protein